MSRKLRLVSGSFSQEESLGRSLIEILSCGRTVSQNNYPESVR